MRADIIEAVGARGYWERKRDLFQACGADPSEAQYVLGLLDKLYGPENEADVLKAAVRVFLRWWDDNHPDDAYAVENLRELVG